MLSTVQIADKRELLNINFQLETLYYNEHVSDSNVPEQKRQ